MQLSIDGDCFNVPINYIEILDYLYCLNFDEEPNYKKIDFMLKKVFLDVNTIPSVYFLPWMISYQP
jgi:hypothetical protein